MESTQLFAFRETRCRGSISAVSVLWKLTVESLNEGFNTHQRPHARHLVGVIASALSVCLWLNGVAAVTCTRKRRVKTKKKKKNAFISLRDQHLLRNVKVWLYYEFLWRTKRLCKYVLQYDRYMIVFSIAMHIQWIYRIAYSDKVVIGKKVS